MRDGGARDGAGRDGKVVRARLPLMWPGFKSQRRRHMWFEFVVGSLLCSERFFSGYSDFPLSSKTNISKFQFDQESGRRRTTLWMCYLQILLLLLLLFVILDSQSLHNDPNCTIKQLVSSLFPFSTFWRFQSPGTRI